MHESRLLTFGPSAIHASVVRITLMYTERMAGAASDGVNDRPVATTPT
jgi:hypothetical protein